MKFIYMSQMLKSRLCMENLIYKMNSLFIGQQKEFRYIIGYGLEMHFQLYYASLLLLINGLNCILTNQRCIIYCMLYSQIKYKEIQNKSDKLQDIVITYYFQIMLLNPKRSHCFNSYFFFILIEKYIDSQIALHIHKAIKDYSVQFAKICVLSIFSKHFELLMGKKF